MIKNQILLLLLVLAIIGNGCASSRRSYITLASIEASVDGAYKTYNDLIVMKKISADQFLDVANAYNAFQKSLQIAVIAAKSNPNASITSDVDKAASNIMELIISIEQVEGAK